MGPTEPGPDGREPSAPDAEKRRARPRPNRKESGLTLLPPAIVPMTEDQHRRAVAALAELLMWAIEEARQDMQAA